LGSQLFRKGVELLTATSHRPSIFRHWIDKFFEIATTAPICGEGEASAAVLALAPTDARNMKSLSKSGNYDYLQNDWSQHRVGKWLRSQVSKSTADV
jgi:hypothetical protein